MRLRWHSVYVRDDWCVVALVGAVSFEAIWSAMSSIPYLAVLDSKVAGDEDVV